MPDAGDMDLTQCNSCGRQISSKSHFCQYCGTSLQDQIDPPATETSDLDTKSLEGPDGQVVPEFSDSAYIPLPAGTRLRDRYIIEKQLGQGGFGRAYRAQDTGRFNEPMVLKELTPSVQGTAALKKAEELFQREAATLHRLEHPQIPKFWEIFQAQKRLFLVQDFVEGRTYQQIQEERQTFNEQEIVQLFRDLLPVLSYLHQQGVVHRDISPDNIMRRDRDGLPILIDLGGVKQIAMDVATEVISAQVSGFSSGGGTRLGKIGFAPDEQMRLGLVAPHSDLYALAVTALVLLTNKSPQQLQDPQSLEWTWQQDLHLNPNFSSILQTMLSARPVDRYQSADEVLQAVGAAQEMPATEVYQSAPPPVTPPLPLTPPPTLVSSEAAMGFGGVSVAGNANIAPPLTMASTQGIQAVNQNKGTNLWKWGCIIASLVVLLPAGLLTLLIIIGVLVDSESNTDDPTPSSSPALKNTPTSETSSGNFQRVRIRGLEPFEHETKTFSIDAPQGWSRKDNSKPGEVITVWTDPTGNSEMVADTFDFGKEPTQAELTQTLEKFLKDTFSEKPDFFVEKPNPQKDGSVLLIWGYTTTASGNVKFKLLGNSFIENKGQRIALLTYLVPSEQFDELKDSLNKMINTFTFDPNASLPD